jgi:LacI family transcriptional regulator
VTTQKPSTRRATILDVAAAAGVSRQTVTRAMNDQSGISTETRDRVMRVVAELGYRPSRFARNFVSRDKRLAVGLVVASFRNPYFTDMAGDFLECAQTRGWQVVMTSPVNAPETEALGTLSTQVDAVVGHFDGAEDALIAAARGLPLVMLERPATRPGVHSVEMDLRLGMQILLTELRERGGRRIGMIDSAYSLRTEGRYVPSPRRAYFEEFAPDCAERVVVGTESIVGGAEALQTLVAEHPEVDSVIVFNDLMALGAIQAAHALHLDVPGQLRIVGIDGLSLGLAVSPLLSTLAIDRRAMAEAALALIDDALGSERQVLSRRHIMVPRPLWRESA